MKQPLKLLLLLGGIRNAVVNFDEHRRLGFDGRYLKITFSACLLPVPSKLFRIPMLCTQPIWIFKMIVNLIGDILLMENI